ncbi:MAG: SAM-dependent methyltransferase, partial [Streptomyces sp.]|nr:SAM-dependent methyltransferase [Streptomyces sp.]
YGGLPVSFESHRLPPARIAALLEAAGLTVTARLEEGRFATFRARRG